MYRVLVPVDSKTDRALRQADYVANLPNARETVEATVLYVFPHQDYEGRPPHEFDEVDAAVEAADYLEDRVNGVERLAIDGEVAQEIRRRPESPHGKYLA